VTGSWRLDAGSYTINMMQRTLTILVCLAVLAVAPLFAQQNERPVLQVTSLAEGKRPAIDGKVDEDSWQTARAYSTFTQQEPNDGVPATERTEVRFLMDKTNVYIGIIALGRAHAR